MPAGSKPICINALLLQNHLGGIGNYCFHLIKHLKARDPSLQIHLLIHAGVAPGFRPLQDTVTLIEVNLKRRITRLLYLHILFPFRTRRYGLLHSIGNMGLVFCPVPQVITLHDVYERVSPERFSPTKRRLMAFLISASGRKAASIITGSRNSSRDIAKYYPELARKISVIPYGNKFPLQPGRAYTDRADFVFVGTLEPGKNLVLALRAFARFQKDHGEKLLVIGATGWKQSHLPMLLDELGIKDRVDFLGYVPDDKLSAILGRCRALLQASTYEGFGLPVIEAMANGCPVISARNSGLIEAGGDAALFFESGDLEGMVRHMEELFAKPELGAACLRKGFAHAAKYTWEAAAEATSAVYAASLRAEP